MVAKPKVGKLYMITGVHSNKPPRRGEWWPPYYERNSVFVYLGRALFCDGMDPQFEVTLLAPDGEIVKHFVNKSEFMNWYETS